MIRLSRIDDLKEIKRIYTQVSYKNMIDDVRYGDNDFTSHIENNNIYVYDDGLIKGFILFYDHITWCYIELLCVDEYFRNQGIGKKLINSVKNENWRCIELCCHITDHNIIDFVKSCDFKSSNQITEWFIK
jgi:ribosomal protein S18 acetylase RimI-like enzyme